MIRLRNPWGKDEWKGAWSDSSKEWEYLPDDVKNDKIDGEFFIALDDFLRVRNHTIIVIVKLIRYYTTVNDLPNQFALVRLGKKLGRFP